MICDLIYYNKIFARYYRRAYAVGIGRPGDPPTAGSRAVTAGLPYLRRMAG
jgi:hypothetical protein